jgi:hypothetical protein
MCHPIAIAAAQAGLQIAGGFAEAQAGRAQARAYRMQGAQSIAAANVEANQARAAGARELGRVRAVQAKNNVDLTSGSAMDVAGDIALNLEHEALMRFYSGRVGKWEADYKAQQARTAAKNAIAGSLLSAGTTLLGSAVKSGMFNQAPSTGKVAGSFLDAGTPTGPTLNQLG